MWWGKQQQSAQEGKGAASMPNDLAPIGLEVNMDSGEPAQAALGEGLRALYARGELCDMALVACGERFPAHKVMLAAMSNNFRDYLRRNSQAGLLEGDAESDPMGGLLVPLASAQRPAGEALCTAAAQPRDESPEATTPPQDAETVPALAAAGAADAVPVPRFLELQVVGLATAEAVRIMLSYMYNVGTGAPWEYEASSAEVNKDILRLSRHFCLQQMHEHAARWLAKGLTTSNVVQRLVTCDEFGLGLLREKIIDQLTANPADLAIVSRSEEITKHPRILQDLLLRLAMLCGMGAAAAAGNTACSATAAAAAAAGTNAKDQSGEDDGGTAEAEKLEKEKEKERLQQKGLQLEPKHAKRAKRGAAGA